MGREGERGVGRGVAIPVCYADEGPGVSLQDGLDEGPAWGVAQTDADEEGDAGGPPGVPQAGGREAEGMHGPEVAPGATNGTPEAEGGMRGPEVAPGATNGTPGAEEGMGGCEGAVAAPRATLGAPGEGGGRQEAAGAPGATVGEPGAEAAQGATLGSCGMTLQYARVIVILARAHKNRLPPLEEAR